MTNIKAIGPKYKADTLPPDPATADIQARIKEALTEIEAFEADGKLQYLSEENIAEYGRIKAMLKAESAAIAGYGIYGPGGPGSSAFTRPDNLEPLWNGVPPNNIYEDDTDRDAVDEDYDKYGDYVSSVVIDNAGDPSRSKLAFQMTDDMQKLTMASVGRDIYVTAEMADGSKKTWVLKEGTVRGDIPIVVSMLGLTHSATLDASHVLRVFNGSTENAMGMTIWGTDFSDEIFGPQVSSVLIGMGGADLIRGGAGNDTIFGDEGRNLKTTTAGDYDPKYGGNDYIDGGAGNNITYAGAGVDKVVDHGGTTESIFEQEFTIDGESADLPDAGFITTSAGWKVTDDSEHGMYVIDNTDGKGGSIEMTMPEGYSYVFADQADDNSLMLTFVGEDGSTFRVKIVDFMTKFDGDIRDRVQRLVMKGGSQGNVIMDFSRIHVTKESPAAISLIGSDNGRNIILGVHNEMIADGVSMEDFLESQGDPGLITKMLEDENYGVFKPYPKKKESDPNDPPNKGGGYEAQADPNGRGILITSKDPKNADPFLNLHVPAGYTKGYIAMDKDGNAYVVFVKPNSSGKADTFVVKIDAGLMKDKGGPLDWNHIQAFFRVETGSGNTKAINWTDCPLTPVSLEDDAYSIKSDENGLADLIVEPEGTPSETEDDDDVIEFNDKTPFKPIKTKEEDPPEDPPPPKP